MAQPTDDRGRFVGRTEADRFAELVDQTGECWLWTGKLSDDGYPLMKVKRDGVWTYVRAHRWAWEAEHGPIGEGLTLDHMPERGCTSTACVRPAHLEPVTRAENTRRRWARSRPG